MFRPFLFLCLALFFSSCTQSFIYEKDISFPEKVWNYENKVDFEFEISDTETLYNLYLDVSHATDFSSQNMYVKFYTKFPSNKILSDVVSLELANKGGIWFGSCDSETCNLRIPIQSNIYFEEKGEYTVTIEQFTRTAELQGVKSLGFKIEQTDKKKN